MKYLHRHPCELDLTLDQMAEVAFIGEELDKQQAAMVGGGLL